VEESRTNYLLNSDSNNPSKWNAYPGVTITTSTTTAPDGSSNAIRIQATTSGQYAERTWAAPTTNTYAGSIYIRSRTGTDQNVRINFSGAGTTVQTVPASGDWVRLRDTHGSTVNAGGRYLYIQSLIGETLDVDVWGEQIELGSFPTSYIPTAGTALTRNADVASITGSNFSSWYNQSEGTVFVDRTYNLNFSGQSYYFSDSGLLGNRFRLELISHIGTNTDASFFNLPALGNKSALAVKTNDVAVSAGGSSVVSDTTFTLAPMDRLFIGKHPTVTSYLNGTISRLTYFPDRLEDSVLQAITQ
jgi:hypothetical protein